MKMVLIVPFLVLFMTSSVYAEVTSCDVKNANIVHDVALKQTEASDLSASLKNLEESISRLSNNPNLQALLKGMETGASKLGLFVESIARKVVLFVKLMWVPFLILFFICRKCKIEKE